MLPSEIIALYYLLTQGKSVSIGPIYFSTTPSTFTSNYYKNIYGIVISGTGTSDNITKMSTI